MNSSSRIVQQMRACLNRALCKVRWEFRSHLVGDVFTWQASYRTIIFLMHRNSIFNNRKNQYVIFINKIVSGLSPFFYVFEVSMAEARLQSPCYTRRILLQGNNVYFVRSLLRWIAYINCLARQGCILYDLLRLHSLGGVFL